MLLSKIEAINLAEDAVGMPLVASWNVWRWGGGAFLVALGNFRRKRALRQRAVTSSLYKAWLGS